MSPTSSSIKKLLPTIPAFSILSSDDIQWLSERIKPFTCAVGQSLLLPDRLPEYCYVIVEGRGRVLHQDPALKRPLTLAYSNPGDLVGWAGLIRRSPCEWITAATPLKLLAFSADTFYLLAERSPSFSSWLDSTNSPSELMAVLEPSLRKRPIANPHERDVLRQLLPFMTVVTSHDDCIQNIDDGAVWLWNAQSPTYSVPVGQPVDAASLKLFPDNTSPRLLRIEHHAWTDLLSPDLTSPSSTSSTSSTSSIEVSSLWSDDRYSDLLAPQPQGEKFQDPVTSTNSSVPPTINFKGRRFPVVSGVGPIGQALACLEMLCLFYNVPFRRDVLTKACQESLNNTQLSLQIFGNLSTLVGFVGSIADIPSVQLHRLPFPCFSILDDDIIMIHDISNDSVNCVHPEYGPITINLSTLVSDQPGASILCLSPGRDSQQRKLDLSWFLPQIKKYRRSLIEVFIASLVLQLLNLAQPLVLQQIFDKVIAQQNVDTLYTLGFVLLGVSLFQGLIGAVRTYLFADTTNRIDISLGAQVIQHLLRLPLNYFDKRPVGELQTRIAELGNIRNFLTGNLLTLVLDSVFSVIYIAVMFMYSAVLTAVTLGVIPLFLGLTVVASPVIRSQLRKAAERNAQTQSLLVESLSGVQTIKAQNAENNIRWQWQRRYSSFMTESFKTLLIGVSSNTVGSFLNQLTSLLTLWVGAFLVIQGDLTIGQLIAFRIISGYVVGPLLNLATSWQTFQSVALSLERLSDVIDAKSEGGDKDLDQLPLPQISGDVSFEGVDFRFNEGSPLVVSNVSFDIPAQSFVGIVGRSGSGKSTIMKLLPRLYSPTSGRILIDGFDINKVQLGSVRQQIGIVPQDSLLFDGTIRDNIALTSSEATPEQIVEAAKVACAHDFIMELENGYATRVGERGSSLSGGQRQRIAIARAVLQSPSLLILDEATSALDYLTERQVCINLKKIFNHSTVFFITHRLSTVVNSDIILMMESGHLVEKGSHQDLLAMQGRYFALYSQQESDIG